MNVHVSSQHLNQIPFAPSQMALRTDPPGVVRVAGPVRLVRSGLRREQPMQGRRDVGEGAPQRPGLGLQGQLLGYGGVRLLRKRLRLLLHLCDAETRKEGERRRE